MGLIVAQSRRGRLASTVLPTLAAAGADANTPPPGLVAETSSPIPKSPGGTSAGSSSEHSKRLGCSRPLMVPATKDSASLRHTYRGISSRPASRKVKSSGMKLGIVSARRLVISISDSGSGGAGDRGG